MLVGLSWRALRDALDQSSDADSKRLELLPRYHVEDADLTRIIIAAGSRRPSAIEAVLPLLAKQLLLSHSNLGQTIKSTRRGGLAPTRLRRVLEHIECDIDAPLLLDQLAASVNLSTFHFAREFAKIVGVPPHTYILKRRVQRALELLADDACSARERPSLRSIQRSSRGG